ncbi:hypothetical protein GCM10007416_34220 [Kroppenstedtia guangzhouensis]|uniref:Uncharacterized protein n=1 Tax=Kroppenstedtia guangzhouensis TaxID=1274356 RepID=A0ABQ1H5I9_9BACL|nr:hypothetical protein GCM10007416_34220 [Kroppenstedtia guangzhouensis]
MEFRIHNTGPYCQIPLSEGTAPNREPGGIRFLGGSLKDLKEMTEAEFEEAKENARRWQPTSSR